MASPSSDLRVEAPPGAPVASDGADAPGSSDLGGDASGSERSDTSPPPRPNPAANASGGSFDPRGRYATPPPRTSGQGLRRSRGGHPTQLEAPYGAEGEHHRSYSDGMSDDSPQQWRSGPGNCWGACGRDSSYDVHPKKIVRELILTRTQKKLLVSGPLRTLATWSARAKRNSRWYYGLTIVTNFQHVASPVLFAVLQHTDVQADPQIERHVYWLAQATSVLATLCFALLSIFLFQDKHELYADMRDELDDEIQQYLALSGPHLGLDHSRAFPVFQEVYIQVRRRLKSKLMAARANSKPPAGQEKSRPGGDDDRPSARGIPGEFSAKVADSARRRALTLGGLEPAFDAGIAAGAGVNSLAQAGFQLPEAGSDQTRVLADLLARGLTAGNAGGTPDLAAMLGAAANVAPQAAANVAPQAAAADDVRVAVGAP